MKNDLTNHLFEFLKRFNTYSIFDLKLIIMQKTILLLLFVSFFFTKIRAQDKSQIDKGAWLVEINTGFGEVSTSNTRFALRSIRGSSRIDWAIGGEVGYFIEDKFALKAGIGYSDLKSLNIRRTFDWKFGFKSYILGKFPLAADINGSTNEDISPIWAGFQLGYAWFVAENVSIEPGVRYALGLNDDSELVGSPNNRVKVFGANIGFTMFF